MKSNSRHSARVKILFLAILLFAGVLIGRLYFLQIVEGAIYRAEAEAQYLGGQRADFNRGTIYFENKDGTLVSAATMKSGYNLAIHPNLIANASTTFEKINAILPIAQDNFFIKAGKSSNWEEIKKYLNPETGENLLMLKIPGVEIVPANWRFYPAGKLAANVLGLVGYQGDTLAGRYGLESYYEDVLKRDESGLYRNIFAEIFSGLEKTIVKKTSLEGDIITTIEPTVENFLEKKLAALNEKWQSAEAGGIIINPKSGEIYAMANLPTFDPNNFSAESDVNIFSNPLVENAYEMGSIIKPLTVAAGLDAGVITATTTYNDTGFIELNGRKISNFDKKARGIVDTQEVLNQSLNTGATFIMRKLGQKTFSQYFWNFGIGEETGIDLPNESPGLAENLKSSRDLEHATASFGQGIALTPIMTARALSILANGGFLITPHLVKKIEYTAGFSKNISGGNDKRVIKKETSEEITRMLVEVVDKALLNGQIKQEHFSVAAKTGTAQIANPAGGGYFEDQFLHSFFGYFPAYEAKFLVFLYLYKPVGVNYASQTLTQPFIDIAKFLLNYYNIPPDR
ncbi:MAG: Peptidoglycan glycosyltransferase [Parcubacteria group bacterium GW2011_GWB1_44_7]|uniref:Peptidoglycan glycosyltransferase n=1 Tax=Candidatus Giovannonibacteria bacterium GW2011_GWA2_45_21 TaxID=1618649 RepID=A0A0G1Q8G0_9BACT|nr:MAG: Peptidoglycan glycosyltransferase [Parcubacteria group bacterium GW2011_GWB1_44_7]KKU04895.1 MAG: Peptidoglycan glycosyltransferase [Candidatus Giovannonibacteria bacterium GW2011_GWA2_45_21]